jgi:DNA-binding NarL/FixJ family response regulator
MRTRSVPAAGSRAGGPATPEDIEILRLLSRGSDLAEVARRLGRPMVAVEERLAELCGRLGVSAPIEAVVHAVHAGWI